MNIDVVLEWVKVVVLPVLMGIGGACMTLVLQRPRTAAEVKKTEADTDAVQTKTVIELWEHLSAQQAQITSLRTDLARLSVENATLRSENATLTAKNAVLEARVSAQDDEIADLRKRVTDYEARLTQSGRAMVEGSTS